MTSDQQRRFVNIKEPELSEFTIGCITQEHSELFILENGVIIMDSQDLSELGMTEYNL